MDNLLGQYGILYYRDAFIFGMIGLFIYKYLTYNPDSKMTSPDVFKLGYWIKTNWFDSLGSFVIFFVWIRFKNEILSAFPESPLVIWLQVFTDSFFIHMMFGILFTHLTRLARKKLKSLNKIK